MKIETFALERWMTRWELDVAYDIAESGIYPMSTRELIDLAPAGERAELLDTLLDYRLGYSEARGSAGLRAEIASTYAGANPDQVLITTGAIEANYLLFNTLLEAGDHVVAVNPAYQQLNSVPKAIGADVSLWKLREENGFRYDLDEFERDLLRPNTRLIVVNTPHNPTGAMLTDAELDRIYALAEARGAWVLCDEAYRWLDMPDGEPLARPIAERGPLGISVGTFSKPFGLPGLRIGWMVAPEEIVAACWGMRDYITLSPGKLNDALSLHALRHRSQIVTRTQGIVRENLAVANAWFDEWGELVGWTPPRGGLLALMNYRLDLPSSELADKLAGEYSVMLAPGSAFGFEHHLRIGIGQRPDLFKTGLDQTADCLTTLLRDGVGFRDV
ncbi:MAG: aminotransferase class I/II-fold pyridoxal phosphate-dependent enzyme [Thermomicrobiales bacterium]|nr:aminotransferase class I/II-fold pyridoxal phosphate-dependent enzyme [Thermomicrobiales bacterium]